MHLHLSLYLSIYSCPIYLIVFKYGVNRINQILVILMFYRTDEFNYLII